MEDFVSGKWGISPTVREAIIKTLDATNSEEKGKKVSLKKTLSELLGVSPQEIVLSYGMKGILHPVLRMLENKGATEAYFLCPYEKNGIISECFKERGFNIIEISYGKALEQNLNIFSESCPGTGKIVVVSNPNCFTGHTLSQSELRELFFCLERAGAFLICDERSADMVPSLLFSGGSGVFHQTGKALILRNFSAFYGLKNLDISYGLLSRPLAKQFSYYADVSTISMLAEEATVAALREKEWYGKLRENINASKSRLIEGLRELGLETQGSDTDVITFQTPHAELIYYLLLEEGIRITNGSDFGIPDHLKISVCQPHQNELFLSALNKVMKKIGFDYQG